MKPGIILIAVFLSCYAGPAAAGRPMVTSVSEQLQEGPDAMLLTAVARALSLDIHFRYAPFKRRLVMMENGDVDLICGLLLRPDRERYIHFVLPPYKTRSDTIFFVDRQKAGLIKSYEDLKGLKIGVVRGARYFSRFDKDRTLLKEPALPKSNYSKLLLGRLDTVIQDESNGVFLLNKMAVADRIAMSPFRFSREKNVYFGISKQSWMINSLDRIEAILKAMILSGQVKFIVSEYYTGQGLPVPAM